MQFYIDSMTLTIESKNYEMYLTQQKIFHQVYIDKCGNNALIEELAKIKNKFLKKSYLDDPEGEISRTLTATNAEHQEILELFKEYKADEVSKYLAEIHWAPENAHFDLMSLNEK